jgi:hypothetical protein
MQTLTKQRPVGIVTCSDVLAAVAYSEDER